MLIGALEAGGVNMIASIGNAQCGAMQRASFPTTTPDKTIPQVVDFFRAFNVGALGIGSFGPLDLNPDSPTYGYIKGTPKKEWQNYPLLPTLREALNIPMAIETAPILSALAENCMGAGRGTRNMLYLTAGAGIGGGILIDGRPVHGLVHPELGHMIIAPAEGDPLESGICPFHRHCLEGLASLPAMEKRWGLPPKLMTADHPAWLLEAQYLAQMCANIIVTISPEIIVLGGEVMKLHPALYAMIRVETLQLLGGYVGSDRITPEGMETYIVPPKLGMNACVAGALLLGEQTLKAEARKAENGDKSLKEII